MGIAVLTMSALFAPLQSLVGWFVSPAGRAHGQRPSSRAAYARPAWVRASAHGSQQNRAALPVSPQALSRPLRVLRVLDPSQTTAGAAGRLVISGRMSDVCAELDRLASSDGPRH
ncbi:MAG: hypothetical protein Q8K31_05985 [Burkholderiaceae bacterium]|nr:hypothetical protein [Burkholderiaceae bacterium]MDO9088513.1 hypothetical protein [Burkholderiaceae bacterium]MDP1968717.1 hypothetical protein [Burkholderiaceae bacterium]